MSIWVVLTFWGILIVGSIGIYAACQGVVYLRERRWCSLCEEKHGPMNEHWLVSGDFPSTEDVDGWLRGWRHRWMPNT